MGDDPAPGVHADERLPLQVPALGRARRQRRQRPGHREAAHRRDRRPRSRSSASARSGRRRGHFDHIHIDVANSGPIGVGGGDGGAVGALEETGLDVKLIDWDAEYTPFGGFGGLASRRLLRRAARPCRSRASSARVLDRYATRAPARAAVGVRGRDRRVRRAQPHLRRPRLARRVPAAPVGEDLGHRGGDHEPRCTRPTSTCARRSSARTGRGPRQSAGQLAQAVQSSGFPLRYDQVQMQAHGADGEGVRVMRLALVLVSCGWRSRAAACSTTSGPRDAGDARSRALRAAGGHEQREPDARASSRRLRSSRRARRSPPSWTRARSGSSTWAAPSASSPPASTPPRT